MGRRKRNKQQRSQKTSSPAKKAVLGSSNTRRNKSISPQKKRSEEHQLHRRHSFPGTSENPATATETDDQFDDETRKHLNFYRKYVALPGFDTLAEISLNSHYERRLQESNLYYRTVQRPKNQAKKAAKAAAKAANAANATNAVSCPRHVDSLCSPPALCSGLFCQCPSRRAAVVAAHRSRGAVCPIPYGERHTSTVISHNSFVVF